MDNDFFDHTGFIYALRRDGLHKFDEKEAGILRL